jgi:hypothetical protein
MNFIYDYSTDVLVPIQMYIFVLEISVPHTQYDNYKP